MKLIDLTGQTFSRLTVISRASNRGKQPAWNCKCSCGSSCIVMGCNLRASNGTKSCGCFQKEGMSKRMSKHGLTNTPEFNSWRSMRDRCLCKTHHAYSGYGGRGITICSQWNSFDVFLSDMGKRPKNHTLDRINNNAEYSPENCRWADWTTQGNNRRNNRNITCSGKTHTLAEWSRITGLHHSTISFRLSKGKPVERALSTPVNHQLKPKV